MTLSAFQFVNKLSYINLCLAEGYGKLCFHVHI